MAKFLNPPPCRWLSDSTDAENEIREIFFQHWEKARDQMTATVNEIDAWRHKFIAYINNHADEQIRNLGDDYDRQRLSLDEKREENLDTTRAYYGAQNVELFNELRNACRSLAFQVAQLEYVNGTMNGPRVITVQEQTERMKNEQSAASKSEKDKPEEKLIIQYTDNIQDNRNENGDLSIKLISPISNETQPHSSTTEPSNENSRSIDSNNDVPARAINYDDSINKCPICFMIFPLNMTQNDRSQHVNEHCTDD